MSKKSCLQKHVDDEVEPSSENYKDFHSVTHLNWYSQFKNRIKDFKKITHLLHFTLEEQRGFIHTKFSFAITPYLLKIIDPQDETCPIRRQFIPTIDEIKTLPEEINQSNYFSNDVEAVSEVLPLKTTRRYLDTLTIFLTDQCAAYCRFCSNKHFVGKHETSLTYGEFGLIINYLKEHPEITQVILSGGDPLTLADEKLEFYLSQLRKIQHISVIVIETRIPVVLPFRITEKLCNIFKKYQPIFLNITFNHPKEITEYTKHACELLVENGVVLLSSTVLLKNINDKIQILTQLFYQLLKLRVKPYQILQCDIVEGTSHFRTSLSTGIKLVKQLRNTISWVAIPEFVVNIAGSKVVIAPQSVISKTRGSVILKDFEDKVFVYPEIR